jgi:HEAT repeat protein
VEREAGEGLRLLTGRDIAADDLIGWRNWWEGVNGLDDSAFKAQLLDLRSSDAVAQARRADSAAAALLAASQQRYRALPPPQQVTMLEDYLRSPTAELREVAVRLVLVEEVNYARDVPASIMRLVRLAITDPDARVRGVAALIVQRRNDTAGVEPLLTQVGRETSQPARVEQIRALGSLGDPSALPMLLGLLNESSPSVRTAAARGASHLATLLDANAIGQTAAAIRRAYESTDEASRSGQRQRADLIAALADLPDPPLADFYRRVLSAAPSRDILLQALRGAATLGDPNLSDIVARFVTNADPAVQEQAVRALGRTSLGFERRDILQSLLIQTDVPDSVRAAAWDALVELFPRARTSDLVSLAEFLGRNKQHDYRLSVLEALAERAQREDEPEQLAWRQHEMADLLMTQLNQPAQAAELWKRALEYSIANGPASTLQTRAENALRCHLRARQFDEAIAFAREMVERNPAFRESVGTIVKREADQFVQDGHVSDARNLIDAVLRQDPPLLNALSRSQLETQKNSLPASDSGA